MRVERRIIQEDQGRGSGTSNIQHKQASGSGKLNSEDQPRGEHREEEYCSVTLYLGGFHFFYFFIFFNNSMPSNSFPVR